MGVIDAEVTPPFGKQYDGTFTEVNLNFPIANQGSNALTAVYNIFVVSCMFSEQIVTFVSTA